MSHVFDRPADFSALKAPKTGHPYTIENTPIYERKSKETKTNNNQAIVTQTTSVLFRGSMFH